MANYFCTDSVEEQVDYLTDKLKDLKNSKSNATNLANGTGDVLIQTTDTNHSFKVMTDGRAKVQSAPVENDDVVRKLELDKKLTKPATPTADSAVTMLADGTVGTKPLSEIGGGGKLYSHNIVINTNDFSLVVVLYKSDNSAINTIDKLFDNLSNLPGIPFSYLNYKNQNHGFVEVSMTGQPGVHALTVIGVAANLSGEVNAVNMSNVNVTTIRDAVIEM